MYKKKNFDMRKLKMAITCIVENDTDILKTKYKDNNLFGDWKSYRELHIEADWLLIYKIQHQELVLVLVRTGKHNQLL
ncbi:type II toxin-antitoxin system YafQ family toxin [Candidatus Enterococcus huntleyi]|uniref:type II toxin-antitoxin system YafQ family toxin n=1 Tax=Candidatus Enterococcus huntleyi TaxID=1857217 RepID=UPI0023516307|nr:type II toxin-antitoxin system YafQ family toxin [Enterococcus sp. JM4C]